MPSASGLVSRATTELATVISRPSRIQATPRAMTMRVWNGDQGNLSIRAGIRLRMAPGWAGASLVIAIERLRARVIAVPIRLFPFRKPVNRPYHARVSRGTPRIETAARGQGTTMQLPEPRGPLSATLCADLSAATALSPATLDTADRAVTTP